MMLFLQHFKESFLQNIKFYKLEGSKKIFPFKVESFLPVLENKLK